MSNATSVGVSFQFWFLGFFDRIFAIDAIAFFRFEMEQMKEVIDVCHIHL